MTPQFTTRAAARDVLDVEVLVCAIAAAMSLRGVPEGCDMLEVAEGVEAAAMTEIESGAPEADVLAAMRLANDLRMRRCGRDAWEETLLRARRAELRGRAARAYLDAVMPRLRALALGAVDGLSPDAVTSPGP